MIYVIRHGQTDWNVEKRTQGSIETSLNEVGREQAEIVRQELQDKKIDVVLCSPRKRCKETAEIICVGNDIIIQELEDLRERDFGEFEGKKKGEDYDWIEFWDWESNHKYQQAECVRDFYERVAAIVEMIKRDYKNKNVLIITHSGVVAMIYCYLNNIKPNGKLNIPGIKNCEITKYNIN